jgi:hypothetical protein
VVSDVVINSTTHGLGGEPGSELQRWALAAPPAVDRRRRGRNIERFKPSNTIWILRSAAPPLRSSRVRRLLAGSYRLVGEDDNAVGTDRRYLHEAQRGQLAPVSEETLSAAQDNREDHQPVLVDQVVVDSCAHHQGIAGAVP